MEYTVFGVVPYLLEHSPLPKLHTSAGAVETKAAKQWETSKASYRKNKNCIAINNNNATSEHASERLVKVLKSTKRRKLRLVKVRLSGKHCYVKTSVLVRRGF